MKVSVIAIFYNSADYVRKCIDSILNQTGVDLELIAVNDCSPDNTLSILQEYSDARLKVVSHSVNKGISAARNTGLSYVTGDCFFFIDGDDFLPEGALEALASHYSADVDWVSGAYAMCDEGGRVKKVNSRSYCESRSSEAIAEQFDHHEFIYTHNKLINAKHKDIRFPEGKAHEDRFWNATIFPRLRHLVNIETPTYCYIMRSTSFSVKSRTSQAYVECAVALLQKMDTLPTCWNVLKWTFMVTAIEKNLYLWPQERKFRKRVLDEIHPLRSRCNLDVTGFPRFTAFVHKSLQSGVPDALINSVACGYRLMNVIANRRV
jgi:glycosyltransferase involved in cell wall biosynthesis